MGKFNFVKTEIDGVLIVEPAVFGDSRGYFMETFQAQEYAAAGIAGSFVQDNQSKSTITSKRRFAAQCAFAKGGKNTSGKAPCNILNVRTVGKKVYSGR